MTEATNLPAYYTVKDLAALMKVSEDTARRYLRTRGVRAERLGNSYIYWRTDLEDRCASAMASMGLLGGDDD